MRCSPRMAKRLDLATKELCLTGLKSSDDSGAFARFLGAAGGALVLCADGGDLFVPV